VSPPIKAPLRGRDNGQDLGMCRDVLQDSLEVCHLSPLGVSICLLKNRNVKDVVIVGIQELQKNQRFALSVIVLIGIKNIVELI